ncbi:MAG: CoA ester lyase [Steroidobacteraceae bacterium]
MNLRSLLFVPGDSERKLAKSLESGADALIVDLEDSVRPERKPAARQLAGEFLLSAPANAQIWVRVNDLAGGQLLKDLAAIMAGKPAGIVLPKVRTAGDILTACHYLDALEQANDIGASATAVLALVTETPGALLHMAGVTCDVPPRLRALAWGAEDLSSALGAGDPRQSTGAWRPLYEHARFQCLLAAHAAGLSAIDTVYVNFRDQAGLRTACDAARHDGFSGCLAIHPDQVPIINAAFTPSAGEIDYATRVLAAFAGGQGTVSLDGKMLDMPHLRTAQRLLAKR